MKRRGSTLIEMVLVIFIISYGATSVYLILTRGYRLAETTSNRIQAINLAREGIESVANIRDTNWLRFPADMRNCWKAADYDASCVGDASTDKTIGSGTTDKFVPYMAGGEWFLLRAPTNTGVYFDDKGLPYQTGSAIPAAVQNKVCGHSDPNSCHSHFFRTLTVGHPTDASGAWWCGSAGTGCLSVTSSVDWFDGSSNAQHTVQLDTVLTNWKENL